MAVGACEHAVVLVPGFLDFGAAGTSARVGDRVPAVLRSALEAHVGQPIPVFALPPVPSCHLATRQNVLLRSLAELDGKLRGVRHFHLVGHGAGGVDAELLTTTLPLKTGAAWPCLDPTHLRSRIASVLTLAAPHYGTQLAERAALGALRTPLVMTPRDYQQAVRLAFALAANLRSHARSWRGHEGAETSPLKLVLQLLRDPDVLTHLCPHSMQALRVHHQPDPALKTRVQSVVVVAPELVLEHEGERRQRDSLFSALYQMVAQISVATPARELAQARVLLQEFPRERVIRHASASVPDFTLAANDGLVNAVRQLLLSRAAEPQPLAGIVVGDHADVLGYYDRPSAWDGRAAPRQGLLRSGARFGDDQFFQLWGLIASRIARVVRTHAPVAASSTTELVGTPAAAE